MMKLMHTVGAVALALTLGLANPALAQQRGGGGGGNAPAVSGGGGGGGGGIRSGGGGGGGGIRSGGGGGPRMGMPGNGPRVATPGGSGPRARAGGRSRSPDQGLSRAGRRDGGANTSRLDRGNRNGIDRGSRYAGRGNLNRDRQFRGRGQWRGGRFYAFPLYSSGWDYSNYGSGCGYYWNRWQRTGNPVWRARYYDCSN